MKKILIAVFLISGFTGFSQAAKGFGLKAGLNYAGTGNASNSAENAYLDPDKNVGFHIGLYGRTGQNLYFRPELVYTNLKSSYGDDDLKLQKLDLPLLVGLNLIGPLNAFAGPSLQYILDTDIEGIELGDVKDEFTVGLNFGVSVDLGQLGIDARYERGFSENEVDILNPTVANNSTYVRFDTRPEQFIISLSLSLGDH